MKVYAVDTVNELINALVEVELAHLIATVGSTVEQALVEMGDEVSAEDRVGLTEATMSAVLMHVYGLIAKWQVATYEHKEAVKALNKQMDHVNGLHKDVCVTLEQRQSVKGAKERGSVMSEGVNQTQ